MSTKTPTKPWTKTHIAIGKKSLTPAGYGVNQGGGFGGALKNTLGAVAFVTVLGLANALATNAGDYAAPTHDEIDADIEAQRIDLCDADGWPNDENSKLAFRRACHTELQRSQ